MGTQPGCAEAQFSLSSPGSITVSHGWMLLVQSSSLLSSEITLPGFLPHQRYPALHGALRQPGNYRETFAVALAQLTHWILCYRKIIIKKSRISGFCVTALFLLLRPGESTARRGPGLSPAPRSRAGARSLAGRCPSAVPLRQRSFATRRVKSNSLAHNTRRLHSQLNPRCFSGDGL